MGRSLTRFQDVAVEASQQLRKRRYHAPLVWALHQEGGCEGGRPGCSCFLCAWMYHGTGLKAHQPKVEDSKTGPWRLTR